MKDHEIRELIGKHRESGGHLSPDNRQLLQFLADRVAKCHICNQLDWRENMVESAPKEVVEMLPVSGIYPYGTVPPNEAYIRKIPQYICKPCKAKICGCGEKKGKRK